MRFVQHVSFRHSTPKKGDRRQYPSPSTHLMDMTPDEAKEIAQKFLNGIMAVELVYGASYVHPDDQFSRRVGFEMAKRRAGLILFNIENMQVGFAREFPNSVTTQISLTDIAETVSVTVVMNDAKGFFRVSFVPLANQQEEEPQHGCKGNCKSR